MVKFAIGVRSHYWRSLGKLWKHDCHPGYLPISMCIFRCKSFSTRQQPFFILLMSTLLDFRRHFFISRENSISLFPLCTSQSTITTRQELQLLSKHDRKNHILSFMRYIFFSLFMWLNCVLWFVFINTSLWIPSDCSCVSPRPIVMWPILCLTSSSH